MNITSYILGIIAAVTTLGVVIEMLRRRRLRERHAIWWILLGLLALIASLFPQLLDATADILGITLPINLVFFISAFILFLVCLQHSSELTALEGKTRTLAEKIAILEMRLSDLDGGKLGDGASKKSIAKRSNNAASKATTTEVRLDE